MMNTFVCWHYYVIKYTPVYYIRFLTMNYLNRDI